MKITIDPRNIALYPNSPLGSITSNFDFGTTQVKIPNMHSKDAEAMALHLRQIAESFEHYARIMAEIESERGTSD